LAVIVLATLACRPQRIRSPGQVGVYRPLHRQVRCYG